MAIERELLVEPSDFRLWVCLHEETHRVQFAAVPWLRDYLTDQVAQVVDSADLDPAVLAQMLRNAVQRIVEGLSSNGEISIVDLVQTPAQREIVDRITAVMSLLEGHADVVMDSVGPEVIPTVAAIRDKFTVRRQGQGFDKVIRKLLGLDAKMRQYRDGAAFCKTVIGRVGMDGLNKVWTSPNTLPTRAEIVDPELWLARVHPEPADAVGHAAAMARRELGPATLAVAQAVAGALTDADPHLLVACSGGPDSLALAFACHRAATRDGRGLTAVVVDHGLQPESAAVADRAREQLGRLGFADVVVVGRDRARTTPSAVRRPRPVPPATPPCRARPPPGRPPSGSATPWTTRRRACCSGWPAGPALGPWPGWPPGPAGWSGPFSVCAGR